MPISDKNLIPVDAPGFMITILGGRYFFIETKDFPEIEGEYLELSGDKTYELFIFPVAQNQLQCTCELMKKTPFKTTWIKIPYHSIISIQKVSENSFIWGSVVKCRSNIILASDFKANIKPHKK